MRAFSNYEWMVYASFSGEGLE